MPVFAWWDWEKSRKPLVGTDGLWDEIYTRELPNATTGRRCSIRFESHGNIWETLPCDVFALQRRGHTPFCCRIRRGSATNKQQTWSTWLNKLQKLPGQRSWGRPCNRRRLTECKPRSYIPVQIPRADERMHHNHNLARNAHTNVSETGFLSLTKDYLPKQH